MKYAVGRRIPGHERINMRNPRFLSVIATFACLCAAGPTAAVEDTWQYTTTDPGEGWQRPDAPQCEQWKSGKAGFGTHGTPGGRVQTVWNTPDIWLRGEYVLAKDQDAAKLSLEVCHDEDFEVYVNGVLAAQAKGYITDYKIYPIAPDARQALKLGKNLIAVHCHQTAGGQFIDVGFTTKTAPYSAPGQQQELVIDDLWPEAAPKYVKRDTWQETMLAVRAEFEAAGIEIDLAVGSALAVELWRDFPHQTDWLMQDSPEKMSDWVTGYRDGKGDLTNFLQTGREASLERSLIEHVLPECGPRSSELRAELDALTVGQVKPKDRRWLDLYVKACQVRRQLRLRPLLEKTRQVVFARHHNMGGGFFAYTEYTNWGGNKYGGLCRLDLDNEESADGEFATVTTLIPTDTGGVIRDPALSYDADRLLFAWRKDGRDRYYKIYELELATGETRLITGADTYGASYDPCYLPDGNILFVSSRVVQSVDCAGPDVSNFFICDRDGGRVRRVGFDQVHTLWPSVLDDGRVVYMRWDYNDRSQIYPQGLLQMNADGTGQTEFYGNNTWEPTTLFHPCGIPGTSKVMAALGGHHNPQCGKLGIIDTAQARQGLEGVTELPSGEKPPYPRADAYAQTGDQYCYPFPLDEQSLLVSYDPIAYHLRAPGQRFDNKEHMRFHLYYMTFDGRREVLSADVRISSLEPIPVIARPVPTVRPSTVDFSQTITITSATPGAKIRIARDWGTPRADQGEEYKGPIEVEKGVVLVAVAYTDQQACSPVVIAPYRIGQAARDDKTVRTFHIGNSLTDTVVGWLQPVAESAGRNLDFHRFTIPGAPTDWLWNHPGGGFGDCRYPEAFFVLAPIDHIFTQPFHGHDRSIPNEVEYSGKFFDLCRQQSPELQAWLYVQWPGPEFQDRWSQGQGATVELKLPSAKTWQEGVANHVAYTEAVAERLNKAYQGKPVLIVPGGSALAILKTEMDAGRVPGMKDFFAEIFADGIHLTPKGRYLISLVHYACIYKESPDGKVSALTTGLTKEQEAIFQHIAWDAVKNYKWAGVTAPAK